MKRRLLLSADGLDGTMDATEDAAAAAAAGADGGWDVGDDDLELPADLVS